MTPVDPVARVLAPEAKAAGANGRVAGREATAAETRPRAGRVAEGVGTATAAERPILEQSALRESVEKLTVAERTAEFNVIVRTPLSPVRPRTRLLLEFCGRCFASST